MCAGIRRDRVNSIKCPYLDRQLEIEEKGRKFSSGILLYFCMRSSAIILEICDCLRFPVISQSSEKGKNRKNRGPADNRGKNRTAADPPGDIPWDIQHYPYLARLMSTFTHFRQRF
jgi:hypothetical protein